MVEWSFDTQDELAARAARRDFARHVGRVYGADADSMAAEIVLGELIGNAVRYAPGHTCVQAAFDLHGVTVAVRDSGKGFSPPARSGESNALSETGRGLSIISRLAQTMDVQCRENDGCTVRARLAIRRAS
jgi:anti-sigma regulatory factor (Ser/Thr protein kinase)